MYRKSFLVKVEIDVQKVTCPGVWLCSNGKVSLQIHMFDSCTQTKTCRPIFPILCNDKFVFSKTFYNDHRLNELQRSLNNEWFYSELIQWKSCDEGCVLATFCTTLDELLYPSSFRGSIAGMEIDLLMEPTKLFPGTISPKLEVSTRTTVEETFFDLGSDGSRITCVRSKPVLSKPMPQKGFPRKVCHSIAFSRAQKHIPLKRNKPKPPFKYSKVSDDLILRNNPNVVVKDDPKDLEQVSLNPNCYCMSKIANSTKSQMIGEWLARSHQTERGRYHGSERTHKEKCSLCTVYDGYFVSNVPTLKISRNTWISSKNKPPRLCSYCKQNFKEVNHPAFRNNSPCRSDVSNVSRKRVCFCSPTEKGSSLAQQLHEKLSRTLDTNSKLFQKCIDCDD